ncbi:hypothetical protein D3C83_70620 [compost metagenome]
MGHLVTIIAIIAKIANMSTFKPVSSSRKRSRTSGKRAGMRLLRIWVPDTRSRRFAAECRRQSLLIKNDPAEKETLEFIERVADWDNETQR